MSRRVLLITVPEPGHLLPTLPIARKLKRLGVEVNYFTSSYFASIIRRNGFATHSYTDNELVTAPDDTVYTTPSSGRHIWFTELRDSSGQCNFPEKLIAIVKRIAPNLILLDRGLSRGQQALLAHLRRSWPVRCFSTSLVRWDDTFSGEHECLVLCPSELELPEFRSKWLNLRHIEPCVDIERHERQIDLPVEIDDKQLIICSFGTQSILHREKRLVRESIREVAIKMPEYTFISSDPSVLSTSTKAPVSGHPSNLLVYPYIPQLSLLRQAKLLITHGGLGSLKEAIIYGVPTIVVPAVFDQPFNAMRVRHLGIGRSVFPPKMNPESLYEAVTATISDRCYRSKTKLLQERFLEIEAESPSQRIIERYLEARVL